jgi:hypothetical protein
MFLQIPAAQVLTDTIFIRWAVPGELRPASSDEETEYKKNQDFYAHIKPFLRAVEVAG